jgi:hypothetical protein
MSSSIVDSSTSQAVQVRFAEDALCVDLSDGRSITVPIAWYPRLAHGTTQERSHWRLIGGGRGVHWPDLDEDISVENLLSGKPSGESRASLAVWLKSRGQ